MYMFLPQQDHVQCKWEKYQKLHTKQIIYMYMYRTKIGLAGANEALKKSTFNNSSLEFSTITTI